MPKATAAFTFVRRPDPQLAARLFLSLALLILGHFAFAQARPAAAKATSPRVQEKVFHSKELDRDMHYMVVLPVDYDNSRQRYPVLYLLHGWAGDYTNWVKLTNLVEYSRRYAMIIVTPDAQNSWYVNSATVPGDRFADYIINDLIREIDSRWRTIASPNHRSIAGLSMGGYGSVLFGLTHASLFAVVGSVSGAFGGPAGVELVMPDLRESTDRAFGPSGSAARIDNNIHLLLAKADRSSVPYLFLECGGQDPLLASNRKFVEDLSSRNVLYEYHEYAGAHTWEFWDNSLPMMLEVIATRILPGKARPSKASSARTP
jgi:putative tributyrin esterase